MAESTAEATNRKPVSSYSPELADLFDLAAPQPRYREMIEGGGFFPVAPAMSYAASRDAVEHVLRHHEVFSSDVEMSLGNVRPLIPLNVDPPRHAKFRKLLDPLFAPKRMDAIEDDVTARANRFIDTFIENGECNFTEEYAELFPSAVFLGLMGLPWEELHTFLRLRDGILRPGKANGAVETDPEKRLVIQRATGQEVYEYFGQILDEREKQPRGDILSGFLEAEIDGERLSRDEILDICFLFLIAGLDTVSDSLTCFYAFLATHPEHRRQIVEDPAIIPDAVEELLRWESPVPNGVPRRAKTDTEVAGHPVTAGTMVVVSYGAANVDPREFPDPFDVRFDRDANRHIAFGGGVHRCLGSHLARRELRITLREWHRRIPDYSIKSGHEQLEYLPGLRSVKDLMLVWPSR